MANSLMVTCIPQQISVLVGIGLMNVQAGLVEKNANYWKLLNVYQNVLSGYFQLWSQALMLTYFWAVFFLGKNVFNKNVTLELA